MRRVLLRSELLKKGRILQDFAYATPGRNRLIGTPGHQSTVDYLVNTLKALDYYDVSTQAFNVSTSAGNVTIDGKPLESQPMTGTPAGTPSAPIVLVANVGCDAADFPAPVAGKIALIKRGSCPFAQKANNAKVAGAIGAIIYNNIAGPLPGTLGGSGNFAPTVGISDTDGAALIAAITATGPIAKISMTITDVTTYNVIAETKSGAKGQVLALGSHTDSVEAGPGINDNGSGTIGILEVAIQLSKFSITNGVRFCWWSGEEEGLLGAEYYVSQLTATQKEQIRLYMNFDMIASPNFLYEIYDGDGSAFNISGAPGSAQVEKLWEDYFKDEVDIPTYPTAFDGRSDYGPFLDAGIAAGGLSSGADGIKTAEQVTKYGGTAGIIYDPNYHTAKDTLENLDVGVWIQLTKGIAHAVATYATSFSSLGPKAPVPRGLESRAVVQFDRKGGKWVI